MTVHLNHFEPHAEVLSRSPSSSDFAATRGFYRNSIKRIVDILLVVLASPVFVPLVAFLAILVWRDGGQPFYRQRRVGKDGRTFWMWKLRSMVTDADALLDGYLATNPEARAEWETSQKLDDDPRITRLGGFLRRSSFDELPQLWNVIRGDMSLVGPRPMMPCQQVLYPGTAYYRLRPGVTGFWQISQRNRSSFASRAKFDAAYDRKMSLITDLRVILGTIRVVFLCTGK
ncbi:sugar transferase [Pararhodobacter sp. SW119]|uniref:sugar transferase n=1 Tax=Pararhodobacter sp. SW119 TaxID=2780075 RepID=UPI001ADFFF5F|nr:sugar transferase [Pararhodobacter sp. SW119]